MVDKVYVVAHESKYYGPFLRRDVDEFTSQLNGPAKVAPLVTPPLPDEECGPWRVQIMEHQDYLAFIDEFKTDTRHALASVIQRIHFARRDDRVLSVRELLDIATTLFKSSRAIESLMHHAEAIVENPTEENVVALRKALWRNRDSDDYDPHYADRFW